MSFRFFYRSFGLVLALLLLLVALSLWSLQSLRAANSLNIHTYEVLVELQRANEALGEMDAVVRAFAINGDEAALLNFRRYRREFDKHLDNFETLTRDQKAQVERAQSIREAEEAFVVGQLEPIVAYRRETQSGEAGLRFLGQVSESRRLALNEVRVFIDRAEGFEEALLSERARVVAQRAEWTRILLWSGGLFSIIVTGVLSFLSANAFKRLDEARSQLESSHTQLEASHAQISAAHDALRVTNLAMSEEIELRRSAEDKLSTAIDDLRRSNSDLEQFAYVASHDLQEPLRAVAGCVQVLKKRYGGKLDERADQFIDHAVDGAQRMQRLIHDLLAYSRAGTRGAPFVPVDMTRVFEGVKRSLSVAIAESEAQITSDDLPTIVADGGQIELVMQNLIGNAIKFRREDEPPHIHVGYRLQPRESEVEGENPDANEVGETATEHVFSIADSGPGIEPQYFERIFIMFQRLHTRERYEGTGIGLAICKKIVERHNGRIWVESTPGKGATFSFAIPAELEEGQVVANPAVLLDEPVNGTSNDISSRSGVQDGEPESARVR